MKSTFLSFGFLLLSLPVLAVNLGQQFHRESLEQQNQFAKLYHQGFRIDGSPRIAGALYFDQKLDHSDPQSKTFKQRYFIDSTFAKDGSSPVFYVICGEWNCAGTGSYGYVEGLARKMRAHIVALEHRFYGESLPTTNLTTENLQFLNLESAIEDLATVQRFLMSAKNLRGKWVSVGGSYAGSLSAFYRLKHPELVAGALASSAPVFTKNDFFEYDAHIAQVIEPSGCGAKVREAVSLIEKKMKSSAGLQEVKAQFRASDIRDVHDFLYVVADMLAAAVQYGNHQEFCKTLTSSSDLVSGYAQAGLVALSRIGSTPMDSSFQIAEKIETTPQDNMRQWMWQSCQEFGWFQVANTRGTPARSLEIDLSYHDKVCQRLYGTSLAHDGFMNQEWYFPLLNPKTSKIIFSNGGNDPWMTLSINAQSPKNPMLSLYLMDGGAHCSDLKASPVLPSVIYAQQEMAKTIQTWVE